MPQTRLVRGKITEGDGLGTIMHFYPDDETAVDGTTVVADALDTGRWKTLNLVPGAAAVGHTHGTYQLLSGRNAANGYAGLGADSKVATANLTLPDATASVRGVVENSTTTEAKALTLDAPYVISPQKLKEVLDAYTPSVRSLVRLTKTATQTYTTGQTAVVTWATNTLNIGGGADQANNRITIPAGMGGYWRFTVRLRVSTTIDGSNFQINILKNGTEIGQQHNHTGSTREQTARRGLPPECGRG